MKCRNEILERVHSWEKGRLFFPGDFSDVMSENTARRTLDRMCKESPDIIRIANGVYCMPEKDTKYGLGYFYPSAEKVVRAIAKRDNFKLFPTVEDSLNTLGLSTQVQMNEVYLTDGSRRKITVTIKTPHEVTLVHTGNKAIPKCVSKIMVMVILAMQGIGKENVSEDEVAILREHLAKVPVADLLHDLKYTPKWMRERLLS